MVRAVSCSSGNTINAESKRIDEGRKIRKKFGTTRVQKDTKTREKRGKRKYETQKRRRNTQREREKKRRVFKGGKSTSSRKTRSVEEKVRGRGGGERGQSKKAGRKEKQNRERHVKGESDRKASTRK